MGVSTVTLALPSLGEPLQRKRHAWDARKGFPTLRLHPTDSQGCFGDLRVCIPALPPNDQHFEQGTSPVRASWVVVCVTETQVHGGPPLPNLQRSAKKGSISFLLILSICSCVTSESKSVTHSVMSDSLRSYEL